MNWNPSHFARIFIQKIGFSTFQYERNSKFKFQCIGGRKTDVNQQVMVTNIRALATDETKFLMQQNKSMCLTINKFKFIATQQTK